MLSHLRFLGQRRANVARTSSISLLQRLSFTTHLTTMKPVPQLLSISRPTSLLITGTKRATPLHRCFSQNAGGGKFEDKEKKLSAIMDALSTAELSHARELFEAVKKHHSEGAAETATRWWLEEIVPSMKENKQLIIVTGWGKNRQMWRTHEI
jgi:hypothetical protein